LPAFALVKVLAPAFYARQDTKTPVRAGIVTMVANMGLNIALVAALFAWWFGGSFATEGLLGRIAAVPGLHVALALSSSLASYLNLWQLWRALRRDAVYQREAGWGTHLLRLTLACLLLTGVIVGGLFLWPNWTTSSILERAWHLAAIIASASVVYVGSLIGSGLRMRDLRAH
jgi:putative peptidoglycan lipid II flippase